MSSKQLKKFVSFDTSSSLTDGDITMSCGIQMSGFLSKKPVGHQSTKWSKRWEDCRTWDNLVLQHNFRKLMHSPNMKAQQYLTMDWSDAGCFHYFVYLMSLCNQYSVASCCVSLRTSGESRIILLPERYLSIPSQNFSHKYKKAIKSRSTFGPPCIVHFKNTKIVRYILKTTVSKSIKKR